MLLSENNLLNNLETTEKEYWQSRITLVENCPDNKYIKRVNNAGNIINGNLVMHNGILVDPLSYYQFPLLEMLIKNKGVHEPQEELIFSEVLKGLDRSKNYTMLELGSYWSFYSIWFKKLMPNSACFMVEPDKANLFFGKNNFKLNRMKGTFIHAGISSNINKSANTTTVDEICLNMNINYIDILHADIQGFEEKMLQGASRMLDENRIGYIFISTHSNELHYNCTKLLKEKYGFMIVSSVDLDESYSWDGILVVKSSSYKGVKKIDVSKKTKASFS